MYVVGTAGIFATVLHDAVMNPADGRFILVLLHSLLSLGPVHTERSYDVLRRQMKIVLQKLTKTQLFSTAISVNGPNGV